MEEVSTQTWNKKKIFIAIFILVALIVGGYLLKTRVLNKDLFQQLKSVKGISVEENVAQTVPKLNIQEAVKEKIDSIKQEVSGLDIVEIASSSPQVQKVLNDIKSLGQYPTNQAKEFCREIYEKICGGL